MPVSKCFIHQIAVSVCGGNISKSITVRAVLENMQLIVLAQLTISVCNGQRTPAGEHILGRTHDKGRRCICGDLGNEIKLLGILIRGILFTRQNLQHKVRTGNVGRRGGRITQNHSIRLILSQQTGRKCQMTAGREAADRNTVRIDIPCFRIFSDIADCPGGFRQRRKSCCIPTGGITQHKGMEAG